MKTREDSTLRERGNISAMVRSVVGESYIFNYFAELSWELFLCNCFVLSLKGLSGLENTIFTLYFRAFGVNRDGSSFHESARMENGYKKTS